MCPSSPTYINIYDNVFYVVSEEKTKIHVYRRTTVTSEGDTPDSDLWTAATNSSNLASDESIVVEKMRLSTSLTFPVVKKNNAGEITAVKIHHYVNDDTGDAPEMTHTVHTLPECFNDKVDTFFMDGSDFYVPDCTDETNPNLFKKLNGLGGTDDVTYITSN